MGELTIEIRYEREDDVFDIDVEAYRDDDDIQSTLDYDKEFQELLQALGNRFTEIVDELNGEEIK